MEQQTFNLPAAREARDSGIKQVALNNDYFLTEARCVAKEIASRRGSVTSDDVRREARLEPLHPNAWGAVFKDPDFEWTGEYRQSQSVSRHGGMQRVWKLKAWV